MGISSADLSRLKLLGVTIVDDSFGTQYIFNTQGLCKLFNLINSGATGSGVPRLSGRLMRFMLAAQPARNERSLRLKLNSLPVYDSEGYQLAIYLNATPPKMLSTTGFFNHLNDTLSLSVQYLSLGDDTELILSLDSSEIEVLRVGGFVEVSLPESK